MKLFEIESHTLISKNSNLFNEVYEEWKDIVYWNKDEHKQPYSIIGKLGNYEIQSNRKQKQYIFALYDKVSNDYALMVSLYLYKKTEKVFNVDRLGVKYKYQGLGLPVKLYTWLIKNQLFILMNGHAQSLGGRKIWEQLAKQPQIFMFGYDFKTKESFQIDQNDIFGEHMYTDDVEDEIVYLQKELKTLYNIQKLTDEQRERMTLLHKQIYKLNADKDRIRKFSIVAMKSK